MAIYILYITKLIYVKQQCWFRFFNMYIIFGFLPSILFNPDQSHICKYKSNIQLRHTRMQK